MASNIIDFPDCHTSFIEQDDTCQSTSIYPESLDSRLCDGCCLQVVLIVTHVSLTYQICQHGIELNVFQNRL